MSDQRENGMVHRADPQYRRRMQILLAVCTIVGVLLLALLYWWIARLSPLLGQGDVLSYQRWLNRLMAGICLLLATPALAFGVWLQRLARATKAERRWPPTSLPTSADMRIRYLTSADALVPQLLAGAWGLYLLALALIGWAAWLLWSR